MVSGGGTRHAGCVVLLCWPKVAQRALHPYGGQPNPPPFPPSPFFTRHNPARNPHRAAGYMLGEHDPTRRSSNPSERVLSTCVDRG